MTAPETHVLGPFIGYGTTFHADCSCSHRVHGADHAELRAAHQKHVGALSLRPGVAKARQALAASLERGKPEPVEVAS